VWNIIFGTILLFTGIGYTAREFTLWLNPTLPLVFGGAGILRVAWPILNDVNTVLITAMIVAEARLRFDRLAEGGWRASWMR
jgi:hypothetical protein